MLFDYGLELEADFKQKNRAVEKKTMEMEQNVGVYKPPSTNREAWERLFPTLASRAISPFFTCTVLLFLNCLKAASYCILRDASKNRPPVAR